RDGALSLIHPAAGEAPFVTPGEMGMRGGVVGIKRERPVEQRNGHSCLFRHASLQIRQRLKEEIISVEALWPLAACPLDSGLAAIRLDDADPPLGDRVLEIEDVLHGTIVFVRPEMRAAARLDQLGCDTQPIADLADTALQHISHAELAPDLP